jgi:hypothetical protein
MVEKYYASVSSGSTVYYIGLEQVGRLWYWPDGTSAGNGQPGNADPYAHWWAGISGRGVMLLVVTLAITCIADSARLLQPLTPRSTCGVDLHSGCQDTCPATRHVTLPLLSRRRYDFLSRLTTNPTWTCIIAYSTSFDYDTVRGSCCQLHCLTWLPCGATCDDCRRDSLAVASNVFCSCFGTLTMHVKGGARSHANDAMWTSTCNRIELPLQCQLGLGLPCLPACLRLIHHHSSNTPACRTASYWATPPTTRTSTPGAPSTTSQPPLQPTSMPGSIGSPAQQPTPPCARSPSRTSTAPPVHHPCHHLHPTTTACVGVCWMRTASAACLLARLQHAKLFAFPASQGIVC